MKRKYITINNEAKKSLLSYGDLIMARTGATYGKTLYFESEFPSVYASFLIKIIPNKNINIPLKQIADEEARF